MMMPFGHETFLQSLLGGTTQRKEAPSFFAITDSQLSSDLLLLREACKNHFFSDISLCHKVLGNGF